MSQNVGDIKTKNNIKGEKFMMNSMNEVTQGAFNEKVIKAMQAYLGQEYCITVNRIVKNNDTVLFGLSIRDAGADTAPTIYINQYYKQHLKGREMSDIIRELIITYEDNKITIPRMQKDDITAFDYAKESIAFKLINLDRNKEFLADVPYIQFHDLAIVFYLIVSCNIDGMSSITIRNNLLDIWSKDVQEIYELAKMNTPRLLPASIKNINQILLDMLGKDLPEGEDFFGTTSGFKNDPFVYVATNQNGINGAAAILYHDLLHDFADKIGADLFVIPSSIHECLLIKAEGHMKVCDIRNMIYEVNDSEVKPDEILGDNVYYYSRATDSISIAR